MDKWLEMDSEGKQKFWVWVCSLKATDDLRGRFIDDTKLLKRVHSRKRKDWWTACSDRMWDASDSAVSVFGELVSEFKRTQ